MMNKNTQRALIGNFSLMPNDEYCASIIPTIEPSGMRNQETVI